MLIGLGGFCLVLAVLLPVFVYPRVAVLPNDPQQSSGQRAEGATILMPDRSAPGYARVLRGVPVEVNSFISAADGSGEQGVGDSVFWQLATRIEVPGRGMVAASLETVSLDRRTGEPTNCCGDRIVSSSIQNGGDPVTHRGRFAFPFDTRKHSYPIWDNRLRRARVAHYVRSEPFDGIDSYVFESVVPLVATGTRDAPGALFGRPESSVTATIEYSSTRTLWVEPASGAVIHTRERIVQQFRLGDTVVPNIDATFATVPMTDEKRDTFRTAALTLPWLRERASVLLVVVAAVLFATVAWTRRRARP